MAESVSSVDSDDGPVFGGTTPASSKEVAEEYEDDIEELLVVAPVAGTAGRRRYAFDANDDLVLTVAAVPPISSGVG